ncbi:RagB/SusD family nutrient uptake outer membrane protein [Tamlana fucoidanivorans]|uniref:RagB/SusD family nutrient uptake outer membrane protein n=1 Tax=Allotamlana fucoidanivorans TaxID=2583814 RepID=A0A5C4SQJ7_9FLAO|nr:RagB/SusD family nutrient uptake outer membrane protein [Tamlana fucoidanivorans]TNJ46065.1 RagB/SusD family nutrient uptake outer membrane protein [Tamlana fucoidanivorans]
MKTIFNTLSRYKMFVRINLYNVVIVCSVAIVSLNNSCQEYLEEDPLSAFSTDEFFTSTTRLKAAVLGIYEELATTEGYGYVEIMLSGDTDILTADGRNVNGNLGSEQEIAHYNTQSESRPIENLWLVFYSSINRANNVIENAHKVVTHNKTEEKLVKAYVAEAKALRAFLYANLVRRWGDVPLRLQPSDLSQNLNLPRSARVDIYEQISKDFEEAIPDLPWHNDPEAELGHLSKGAAMGLYVRAMLFAGGYNLYQDGKVKRPENYLDYYNKAEKISKELIESNRHELNPDYEDIYRKITGSVLEPSESMFEIDLAVMNGSFQNSGRIGSRSIGVRIKNYTSSTGVKIGTNIRMTTSDFLSQKFQDGDLRRDISIADFDLIGDKATNILSKKPIPYNNNATYGCAKWRRDWHFPEAIQFNNTDANYVILRYSDVLLMRAEVLNELNNGPTEEAIELVNKVRRRGYGFDINSSSQIADVPFEFTTDKETFLNFLIDENAREFSGEGNRKFHLIRWNILQEKLLDFREFLLTDPKNKFYGLRVHLASELYTPNKHELYPIPHNEILDSNFLLTQNPGY